MRLVSKSSSSFLGVKGSNSLWAMPQMPGISLSCPAANIWAQHRRIPHPSLLRLQNGIVACKLKSILNSPKLAGPTRREWGNQPLLAGILGIHEPSFPTKGQLENWKAYHQIIKSHFQEKTYEKNLLGILATGLGRQVCDSAIKVNKGISMYITFKKSLSSQHWFLGPWLLGWPLMLAVCD